MRNPATAGADMAPASLDMSGVDPARWPEIRRRVAILDEFVALHRPSLKVRTAFAERMGISVSQFFTLARVWRTTRSAAAIPGARSRISTPRDRRLPAKSIETMNKTIADLGPLARRKDVIAEVGRRCAASGIAAPSNSTITNALSAARTRLEAESCADREILIDECVVKLPVAVHGSVAMPRLLLAVALPARTIVAYAISCDPATAPSTSDLMDQLSASDATTLPIRAPHLREIELLHGTGVAAPGAPTLARVLGDRIGSLTILHRPSLARPGASLVTARHASPLGEADAVAAIITVIGEHNARVKPAAAAG